jgi:hypothetical protein
MQFRILSLAFLLLTLLPSRAATAAECGILTTLGLCTTAGRLDYDAGNSTWKFCNGANWVSAGGAVSATPCSTASQLDYGANKFTFCNGAFQADLYKGAALGVCTTGGQLDYDSTQATFKYCDGSNWFDIGARTNVPTAGLVGHWTFNEGSGTSAYDTSGNGNIGSLLTPNGPAWTASGKIDGGLILDATDDHVTVPHSASLNMTNALTIALWFKPGDLDSRDHDLVTKGTNTPTDRATFEFALRGSMLLFGFCTGTNSACAANWNEVRTAPLSMTVGSWHHVAVTFNDVATNQFWFYLDGVQYAGGGNTGSPFTKSMVAFTDPIKIGRVFASEAANATVDDVRLYNRVLTTTEIGYLYNAGAGCE